MKINLKNNNPGWFYFTLNLTKELNLHDYFTTQKYKNIPINFKSQFFNSQLYVKKKIKSQLNKSDALK